MKIMRQIFLTVLGIASGSFSILYAQTTQTFTTSGTFTVPTGVTSITVECWGGGGSGGGQSGGGSQGGGGGGAYSSATIAVAPGAQYSVNVGIGGVGTTSNIGTPGGDSWFGSNVVLAKGGGGSGSSRTGGLGGVSSSGVGTTKFSGGNGGPGSGCGSCAGGGGGSSAGINADGSTGIQTACSNCTNSGGIAPAGGGNGGAGGSSGESGSIPGGGGGGSGNSSGASGGNGANGQVKVTYTEPFGITNDQIFIYTNGTDVETIVFTLNRVLNLNEGASVTGISTSGGTISSAIYSGKGSSNTITLTSTANGAWTIGTTVSYSSGNIADLTSQSLGSFSGHVVIQKTITASQSFSSSGNFIVPAGITSVNVECWGGGGSGGASTSGTQAGGGGGGGAYSKSTLSVTPLASYTVTVGLGGAPVIASSGIIGGDSWFGTSGTILAKGGSFGASGGGGGAGGQSVSGIGTTKFSGGNGGSASGVGPGGGGGSSAGILSNGVNGGLMTAGAAPTGGGSGGTGGLTGTAGSNGQSPGGGGGGSGDRSGSDPASGAGGNGMVTVTYTDIMGPGLSPDVMTFYHRGSLVERIEFKLNKELSLMEGSVVTGFSVNSGSIASAIYTGKGSTNTITLTSSANGDWTSSTTVSYTNGNVAALNNQVMANITNHILTDYVPYTTQTYTTSGTFTVPGGNSSITVECWGAGGAGGSNDCCNGGGGGGGGAYSKSDLAVTSGQQLSYSIGSGGTQNCCAGGDTWFGSTSTILAKGGNPGSSVSTGGTGGQSTSGIGTIKFSGGNGGAGKSGGTAPGGGGGSSAGNAANGVTGGSTTTNNVAGVGAEAPTGGGKGGNGGLSASAGNSGGLPGGGGGGAGDGSTGGMGGKGADGQIKITFGDYSAPYISQDVITLNSNGSLPETIVFTLSKELDLAEGATLNGFSVSGLPPVLASAIYSGKGTTNKITLTSAINGSWTSSSTVSYSSGNVLDLLGQSMGAFSNHAVVEAPTTLMAGDIAFTGYNSSNLDEFSFVLLKDVAAPTTIYFTDNGWNGTSLQTAETTITWTAGAALQAGTAIRIYNTTSSGPLATTLGNVTSSGVTFALVNQDNILAYQGSTSSPTFLAGILNNTAPTDGTQWNYNISNSTNLSVLPTGLTNGVNAMNVGVCSSNDNLRYNGITTGSAQQLRSDLNNCTNWTSSCCTIFPILSGINVFPIIPVVTAISIPNTSMKVYDFVTATLTVHDDRESLHSLNTGTIDAIPLSSVIRTSSTTYTASFNIPEGGTDVAAANDILVSLNLKSSQGNVMPTDYSTPVSQLNDPIDANSPKVLSINRISTTNSWSTTFGTSASSVLFQVTFSESINASTLSAADFSIPVTGSLAGAVVSNISFVSGSTYNITVSGYTGTGTIGLNYVDNNDVNAVQDVAGNSTITSSTNADGDFTGPTYSIVLPAPSNYVSGFTNTNQQSTSITAQWTGAVAPVTQATHYLVMLKTAAANFPPVNDGTSFSNDVDLSDGILKTILPYGANSAAFSGLAPNTSYNLVIYPYTYVANYTTDNIDYFNPAPIILSVTTAPAAPTNLATSVTTTTNSSFNPTWTASPGATKYFLDVSTVNNFASFVGTYNNLDIGSVTSYSVNSGLAANTLYYYKLRASNTNGTSPDSNIGSVTTAPPPPTVMAGSSVTDASFTANWSTSTAATKYFLDVSTVNNFSTFVNGYNNLDVGNVTSYAVNPVSPNLSANSVYYVRVRANNVNGTSVSSGNGTVTTAPAIPATSPASNISQTSFVANWTLSTAATGYFIDVATTSSFTAGTFVTGYSNLSLGNVNNLTVNTNLSCGLTYYYRVRATNANGTSGSSSVISLILVPCDPTSSNASSIGQTNFTANWVAATGANNYYMDVSTSNTFSPLVTGYSNISVGNVTSYVVNTNLATGTTYYYRVRASNGSGTTFSSGTISLTTVPPNPVATSATSPTQTTFTANWNTSLSATSYRLDVSTDNTFASGVVVSDLTVAGLTSNVTGLTPGTTYHYRVRAVNGSGTSGNSNTTSITIVPPNPVSTNGSAPTASSFTANWNAALGATSYSLDYSTNSNLSSPITINNISVTNASIAGLSANTTYYYQVRASNSSGTSSNSNISSQLTLTLAPVANAASAISPSGFTANWATTTGANSYRLDVASDNSFTTPVSGFSDLTVNTTSSGVTGLTAGNTYYYRVRAVNAAGPSANSNTISQITISPAPVAIDPTFITTSSFTANWQAANGAASYRLDVSPDNFSTFVTGFNDLSVTFTSTSVTGLSEGITYQYRVRAVNVGGTSANSNSIAVVTVPPVPTAAAATSISTSGFTANWSLVSGATEYLLDISSDNFSSYLTGYINKSLATNSELVTGLQPNTTYQYRVRAKSSSGTSANSATISVLTYSVAPVAVAATAPTQTGLTANWNAITGITNFKLDVSSDDFATRVSGFDDLSVTGTSKVITGLASGVTYKYRLRAVNATGPSGNSNVIGIITIPATPVASAATSISQTGFTLNWNSVLGADSYILDVSTASNFSSFVDGYQSKSLVNTSESLSGLANGTRYYFRVKSKNNSGESGFSSVASQITIPKTPDPNPIADADIGSTTFIASWQAVQGVDYYEIDVTTASSNFSTFVGIYNAENVGNEINVIVQGLSPATSYYFRVRAVNAGGKSPNSIRRGTTTKGGDPSKVFGVAITSFSSSTVQVQISSPLGAVQANLLYHGITETENKPKSILVTGEGVYSVSIDETMMDDLGVEFFVSAVDEKGIAKVSSTERVFRTYTAASSPAVLNSNFEGTRASIKIISIPYDLKDNLIESIFSPLGIYDKKSWRLAHYVEGQGNVEYKEGTNKINRGEGYWFNAVGTVNVKSGEGNVGAYTTSNPFKLSLVSGWNEIGNPYPFAIDWSDVLGDNPSVGGVGTLKVYNGAKSNYDVGNKMEPFTGGFVHSDNNVTLNVNVTLKSRANGGRTTGAGFDLAQDSWRLPLIAKQNGSVYDLGGVGMEPDANLSKDTYDEIRLPRLEDYLDITFEHPEYRFKNFTQDIQPTQDEANWRFFIAGNVADPNSSLEWDNTRFGINDVKVFLLDVETVRWINMRSVNRYDFENPGKKEFRIYFSKNEIIPNLTAVSPPYPNTTGFDFTVSLTLPSSASEHHVELDLVDMMGRNASTIYEGEKEAGVHLIRGTNLDSFGNKLPSGVYLVRTKVNNRYLDSHRLVIKN